MKTKLLFAFLLLYASLSFAQTKSELPSQNQKFYFPNSSFLNPKEFEQNFNTLVLKIAPIEIDEKNQKYSNDAENIYLLQKNYKGLVNYSKNENFPKESLPLKSFAEAMVIDPSQGNLFKKTFVDHFSTEFNKMDESTKAAIANTYFDEKMLDEYQKMAKDFKDQLSKNKSDSITYADAKKLISFENLNLINTTILPLGKSVVKDYILEYFQPYLTGNLRLSILKPKEVNDLPDISKDYKILFEITNFNSKDDRETAYKNENAFLLEAGRIINLHIASGIPPEKLKIVLVIHGSAVDMLLTDQMYKKKYKVLNPNLALIKQMQSKGIKLVVCGQLMTWKGLKLSDLTENVKEAYSAKTALSNYQSQGFVLYKIEGND